MENKKMIPQERILNKIVELRGEKVMLDRDLALLYGVKTKVLKQAVGVIPNAFLQILF